VETSQYNKTLELDPDSALAHQELGRAYVLRGELEEGIAELEKMRTIVGSGPHGLADLGYAYARAGRESDAARILEELLHLSSQGYALSYQTALVYWGLEDKNHAREWLEKAYEKRNAYLLEIGVEPMWDGLRSDTRFMALMKKIGLGK